MSRPESEPHFAVGISVPPYDEVRRFAPASTSVLGRGSLLIVEACALARDWTVVSRTISATRARHPTAPVILCVPEVTPETLRVAHRSSRVGVRAIVARGEALEDVLRPLLTRPDNLAVDLIEWLEFRGRMVSPSIVGLVRDIVELAPRYAQLNDLLSALGQPERTVRSRFQCAGWPGPAGWHRCARALHGALRVQSATDVRVLELALDMGYSDHSGLTRQLTRAFGITPAGIRGTLGWEWLAERWLADVGAFPRR
jgi:AraC-like DNA-binding protein